MTIALVIAGPYPAPRGSQVLVKQMATGLGSRGHIVHVVAYGRWLHDRPGFHPLRLPLDVWLLLRLCRTIWRERVDVVHAHNYEAAILGLIAGRLFGRPVVYHGHGAMRDELPTYARGPRLRRLLRRVGAWLDGAVPRRADCSIAVTAELAERLRELGAGTVVRLEPRLAPEEVLRAPGAADAADENVVVYAGNLDGYQNLAYLLGAFARVRRRVPAARLRLLTHAGAERAAQVCLRQPGVEVVETASFADVRDELARATVLVSPREERCGFPMKLLNYMAAGKAIVATTESAKGLHDGVTGLCVGDGEAGFASAIVDLLRDAERRQRLGDAARAAVTDPARWTAHLDALDEIYQGMITGDPDTAAELAYTE
jgi:glycosyltransferase involved in cell wall biosynthesis